MRKFKCPYEECGKSFKNNTSLIEHLKAEHIGKLSKESIEYLKTLKVDHHRKPFK